MKIHAVRLKEVGHFATGVALEGLSGRFDLIAGPNEMGKSTIFKAIEAAFGIKHDSEKAEVRDLAPLTGGSPLIEIEFEMGGTKWRLRKRYLAQRSAELVDLGASRLLRGGDAEERLKDLLGGSHDRAGMRRLLWVGQRQSHVVPDQADVALAVGNLIEAEIADAAGQGIARRLRQDVAEALAGLVTPTGRPKAKTPYKTTIDARDAAKAELERLRNAAAEAEARLSRLSALRARQEEINSPALAEQRRAELTLLRKRRDDAESARKAFEVATLVVAAKEAARDKAAAHLLALTTAAADEARFREARRVAIEAMEIATADLLAAEAEAADLQQRRSTGRKRLAELQEAVAVYELHQRQQHVAAAVEELQRRRAAAAALRLRIHEIAAALAAEPVDNTLITTLRRAAADLSRAEAKLGAILPSVSVEYAEGAAGRVKVGGVAVDASGDVAPAALLELEIAGVGRITVQASVPAGVDPVGDLAAARLRYDEACRLAGVDGTEEAEARLASRQILTIERESALSRLTEIAPEGTCDLDARLAAAIVESEAAGPALELPPQPRETIAAEHQQSTRELEAIEGAERTARATLLAASGRVETHRADHANAEHRLNEVVAKLPPADARESWIAEARKELDRCNGELNLGVRERTAWQAALLQPNELATLQSLIEAAEKSQAQLAQDRHQIALDIKGLESGLERDRQDGIASALDDAQATFAQLAKRVGDYEREKGELQLLDKLLADAAAKSRSQELLPVVTRLQEFANELLPGARFELGGALRVDGVVRAGQKLSTGQLSGGTSEQIHVLVRMAYARIAADRGAPMPLILDDALVYADDARLEAMLVALASASNHHQVIMLTCHAERTVKPKLCPSMNVVALANWDAT